jgi:predicted RNA binding protein YcfA (HicA-like mRNA interferase family)
MIKIKELIKIIEDDGWYQVRQKGSHRQFHHSIKKGTVTINGKASDDLSHFLIKSIEKQADIKL